MKKDYRYLAGIIDGEGCINISNSKNEIFHLRIMVKNTSKDLIFWLKEKFDGGIYFDKRRNEKWRDTWVWYIDSGKTANILKKVLPYLIIKKQQAKLAIKFQNTKKYKGTSIPEKIKEQRKKFYDLMKQLNKRGI